jgi:hypothetical protein
MSPVIEERLAKIAGLSLKSGSHSPDSTFCVMEAVAFVAGEPWSDHPQCACPVISAFLRSWNDSLPSDDERDRLLKPLVARLVGTKSTKAIEKRRATMAVDWMVRTCTPTWLRLAGLTKQAEALESLPEITDFAKCPSLKRPLEAARKDAAAAGAAAGAAAWAATWAAALDAAGDAAWAATWAAALDAAGDAAWAAARDAALAAAGAAAGAAARKKLAPTVLALQESALQLVNRMICCDCRKFALHRVQLYGDALVEGEADCAGAARQRSIS